jgi:hypothetical protein
MSEMMRRQPVRAQRWMWAAIAVAMTIPCLSSQEVKNAPIDVSAAGDFFIISSVDLNKRQILLKLPTEVTQLIRVDNRTQYLDAHGKAIRLTDLRAGDTVYIVSNRTGDQTNAIAIRKGPMTVEVLRERYLHSKN